jgi:hypothetical protein
MLCANCVGVVCKAKLAAVLCNNVANHIRNK